MLELHQFRHSPYCLKVRMALAAKKLEYRTVEITPAIGQIDIFQKTGQKKLPVLFDKETTIHESSSIIRHLEKIEIEPKLIPESLKEASQAQIIENWADTTLAKSIKIVFNPIRPMPVPQRHYPHKIVSQSYMNEVNRL